MAAIPKKVVQGLLSCDNLTFQSMKVIGILKRQWLQMWSLNKAEWKGEFFEMVCAESVGTAARTGVWQPFGTPPKAMCICVHVCVHVHWQSPDGDVRCHQHAGVHWKGRDQGKNGTKKSRNALILAAADLHLRLDQRPECLGHQCRWVLLEPFGDERLEIGGPSSEGGVVKELPKSCSGVRQKGLRQAWELWLWHHQLSLHGILLGPLVIVFELALTLH